jgi:hypothetical protein
MPAEVARSMKHAAAQELQELLRDGPWEHGLQVALPAAAAAWVLAVAQCPPLCARAAESACLD